VWLDPELARVLFPPRYKEDSIPQGETAIEELTLREIEVLRMMAEGLGNKEIAGPPAISDRTVTFHVSSILAKLEAATRTEAVTVGVRMELILLQAASRTQPDQYTVYPGAGVRKSGLLAMSSKAPVFLNAFKSARLWNDLVT
jgi:DNA-binding CsgD family transcriptional regulator